MNNDLKNLVSILNEGYSSITPYHFITEYIKTIKNMSKNRMSNLEVVVKYTDNYFKRDDEEVEYDKIKESLLDNIQRYK